MLQSAIQPIASCLRLVAQVCYCDVVPCATSTEAEIQPHVKTELKWNTERLFLFPCGPQLLTYLYKIFVEHEYEDTTGLIFSTKKKLHLPPLFNTSLFFLYQQFITISLIYSIPLICLFLSLNLICVCCED